MFENGECAAIPPRRLCCECVCSSLIGALVPLGEEGCEGLFRYSMA